MFRFLLAVPFLATLALPGQAAESKVGLQFNHHDWELTCDNTRTCRAAGYQSDEELDQLVSVLLTREAGPGQPVSARLQLSSFEEAAEPPKTPRLYIDGKDLGELARPEEKYGASQLSRAQTDALLASLRRDSEIHVSGDGRKWKLSDMGATAVLLKMDEFQGRLGTVGALIRKGSKSETGVLPPLPKPTVAIPAIPATTADDRKLANDRSLRALLKSTVSADESSEESCADLLEPRDGEQPLEIARLSKDKLLVSTRCWLAAYNAGSGYWVINATPPYQPQLVTTFASDFDNGTIHAGMKARGLGDCWSVTRWSWNGKRFVETFDEPAPLCKGFAGGAWEMPLLVSDVQQAK